MTKGEQARLTAWRWKVLQQAMDEQNVAIVFEPMELLERLAVLTPRPRVNLIL